MAAHLAKEKTSLNWALGKIGRIFLNSNETPKRAAKMLAKRAERRTVVTVIIWVKKKTKVRSSFKTESITAVRDDQKNFFSARKTAIEKISIERARPKNPKIIK